VPGTDGTARGSSGTVRALKVERGDVRARQLVLSAKSGGNPRRRRAGSNEHGAIRKERTEHGAEGQVSSTKQFVPGASAKRCVRSDPQAAQGGKRRERSNPGATRKVKCRARSNSRPVRGARSRARSNPTQTPRQKVLSLDRSARNDQSARTKTGATQGGKRRARSNPGTARKAKYRARSNPRMVRSAEVLSTA